MVAETADSAHADVARLAAGAVEHALACGVTVGATGRVPMLGATSGAFAQGLDDIQYDIDDGPCLTCLRTATVVAVDDVAAEPRWPDFTRR
ncbi:MAG: transcriptional regulator, partial [Pseudonocardiales bacterium]|nr:transcriptional regulator [Pseudonocardiales bacterium]